MSFIGWLRGCVRWGSKVPLIIVLSYLLFSKCLSSNSCFIDMWKSINCIHPKVKDLHCATCIMQVLIWHFEIGKKKPSEHCDSPYYQLLQNKTKTDWYSSYNILPIFQHVSWIVMHFHPQIVLSLHVLSLLQFTLFSLCIGCYNVNHNIIKPLKRNILP